MKKNRSTNFLPACLLALLMTACGPGQKAPDILGKWQVNDVYQDGQKISGGRNFRGTVYEFRENGKVWSQIHTGDTAVVSYAHRGDSLFWITLDKEVGYGIDSLSENFLRFSGKVDGFRTAVEMRRTGE